MPTEGHNQDNENDPTERGQKAASTAVGVRSVEMPPPRQSSNVGKAARPAPRPPPRGPSSLIAPPPASPDPVVAAPEPPPPPLSAVPSPPAVPPTANKRRPTLEYRPGESFADRYRMLKLIGRGGMGAVYLAEQTALARKVAIKLLHGTADEMTTARFQREARVIAQLQHPHIVNLIDFGDAGGQLYLVMEFIDGETISSLSKREGALSEGRALDLAIQIAEALAVAHGAGIVHRDVKPDNLMVMKTSTGKEFAKVLDFGVAKLQHPVGEHNTIQTQAGMIVGSLRYIAPEQLESKDVTARTDIYAFGCVLYEMVTGRRVFEYASLADCALAHLGEKPKPPSINGRELTTPLARIVMQCLEKDPLKRPADAGAALPLLLEARRLSPSGPSDSSPRVSARYSTGLRHLGGSGISRGQVGNPGDVAMTMQGDQGSDLAGALGARRPSQPLFLGAEVEQDPTQSPTAPGGQLENARNLERAVRPRADASRRDGNDVLFDGLVGPVIVRTPEDAPDSERDARPYARESRRPRERAGFPMWLWAAIVVTVIAFGLALGFFLSRQGGGASETPTPSAEARTRATATPLEPAVIPMAPLSP